ncbi:hypothetical protein [Asanoa siamensis]|uniref:Uncharacterized protein n=1 Tax=Asanoa siamensis TaxID=926357 RepID=A0ABQ4CY20_9ACTN|nr:hypothetical protein [Asanoa siamensis]GIF76196.1 hypothetical protein Asi02nite_57140 [Asanoa siamensis]
MSSAQTLEDEAGHPGDMWSDLKNKIQDDVMIQFSAVEGQFLAILWCLDRYRAAGVPPRGMGDQGKDPATRLNAVYRSKGHWWAELISLLVENRTSSRLEARVRVRGFSQDHTIDVAWPSGTPPLAAPRICLLTRMSGAAQQGDIPERKAMADWVTRRKELKFAATDLKLSQHDPARPMGTWDQWRRVQPPKVYLLWGARLGAKARLATIAEEASELHDTYLDGVGVFAYAAAPDDRKYQPLAPAAASGWTTVDTVLDTLATAITEAEPAGHRADQDSENEA